MDISNNKLNVTDLDFDQIKANLKSFLTNQSVLSSYDFSASALNQILNVLSYNTHYNAYYMNMLANEMFLETASIRSSVSSKAKMLNYVPRSMKGSEAQLMVDIIPLGSPDSIVVDKYTKFNSVKNGKIFTFTTLDSATIEKSTSGNFQSILNLREGYPTTFTYTKDSSDPEQRFIIPNSNVDVSTIEVTVRPSESDLTYSLFQKAGDFTDLKPTSNVYFCSETTNGRYEVEFGDGNVSRGLSDGNIVQIKCLICNGKEANGCFIFNPTDSVGGYNNVSTKTLSPSFGGSERETIESIKFNAPKTYAAQKRAVTAEDYQGLIYQNFPDADSVQTWGGEEESDPVYGRVYIVVKPKTGDFLTSAQRSAINTLLTERKMMSITPVIVDPVIFKIVPEVIVKYDSVKSLVGSSQIGALVKNTINDYNNSNLKMFGRNFKYSKLLNLIENSENSITNALMSIKCYTTFTPSYNLSTSYEFKLNNEINHPFQNYEGAIDSTSFTYTDNLGAQHSSCRIDDLNGVLRIYRMVGTNKSIVRSNVGTVNYSTGLIKLSAFLPVSAVGNIVSIYIEPRYQDLVPVREQILKILERDITITMIDVNALERRNFTSDSSLTTTVTSTGSEY
tara:strand:- start:3793 stop:5652 length:1860 start_codon:yes stop_codon:yes gene_type:complete